MSRVINELKAVPVRSHDLVSGASCLNVRGLLVSEMDRAHTVVAVVAEGCLVA